MSRAKRPRWYVDADTLSLAHVLIRALPQDVTYPGDPGTRYKKRWNIDPCIIADPSMLDEEWIPRVAAAGLAIITRDQHIETRTSEKDQVIAARARMFAITTPGNLDTWGLVEVIATQWRKIEDAAQEPGPYIYSVTRTSLTKIDLF